MPKRSFFRPRSWTKSKKGKKKGSKRKGQEHYGVVDLDADGFDPRRANVLVEPMPHANSGGGFSLGTGEFPMGGPILFNPSADTVSTRWSSQSNCASSIMSGEEEHKARGSFSARRTGGADLLLAMKSKSKDLGKELMGDVRSVGKVVADTASVPVNYLRKKSLFMRTSDLGMNKSTHSYRSDDHSEMHPHYHHPSDDPPPGVDHDPKEAWVALDTGAGQQHSPVAPYAVDALAKSGYDSAMHKGMWTPNRPTEKILGKSQEWSSAIWQERGEVAVPSKGSAEANEVLVWSGNFSHGFYGSDLPTVRAEGVINMSPRALVDLLMDSSRVHEYNKMSLGRDDVLVLQDDLDNEGPFGPSITKVVRSASKPPLVRRPMEFVSLMHVRRLEDGNGYLIVSRAVTQAEDVINADGKVLRSEILMGVNIIRNVVGDENRSVMINVNHVRSPMVPMMIAKKIGLTAAVGFFNDLRALC